MVNEREIVALIAEGIGLARQGEYGKALKIFDKDPCCTLAGAFVLRAVPCHGGGQTRRPSVCVLAAEKSP